MVKYTGYKDKSSKKLYTGDIVKMSNSENEKKIFGYGRCSDCDWYGIEGGCNVERNSKQCELNKNNFIEYKENESSNSN